LAITPKNALKTNSETQVDVSHPHLILISQQSLGVEDIPVENQTIQLLIFKNNKTVSEQVKVTDKKGMVDFVFVTQQVGSHMIIVVNKTDVSPFIVKSMMVSL
jgi:hypothetical protein